MVADVACLAQSHVPKPIEVRRELCTELRASDLFIFGELLEPLLHFFAAKILSKAGSDDFRYAFLLRRETRIKVSKKGPLPFVADNGSRMHKLWHGIDAKLDYAQFHFDKASEALSPPRLDAHMVAIEAILPPVSLGAWAASTSVYWTRVGLEGRGVE